ncbi:30S ribosomal protein S6e [Candidatus Micrarchaeota archaeon]|nr:30S ribosomal protein S6e [Candidatus Micrarchaeota archaeon]
MKIVFSDPKNGKSFQKEVDKAKEGQLFGKKIGEKVSGSIIGLDGYELQLTGGSTNDGTPMREDIPASKYVDAMINSGAGIRAKLPKGTKVKKRVCGNTIAQHIAQINAKITTAGAKSLEELGFTQKPKEKKAEGEKKEGKN